MSLWYLYVYLAPSPNGYVLFQPFIESLSVDLYLVLLNLYSRDPSLERKASFFLKVVFVVTLKLPSTTLGIFWAITNWRHCWGEKVQIFLGYERHSFRFDCWWWTTVRYQQGCASLTWRLHLRRIQFSEFLWWLHCQKTANFEELIQFIHLSRWVLCL